MMIKKHLSEFIKDYYKSDRFHSLPSDLQDIVIDPDELKKIFKSYLLLYNEASEIGPVIMRLPNIGVIAPDPKHKDVLKAKIKINAEKLLKSKKRMNNYKKHELLARVKSLPSFTHIPKKFWIIGIRSNADLPDRFDDRFYIFYSDRIYTSFTGTTNPGVISLFNYQKYNTHGTLIVKSDEFYYDLWKVGLHQGNSGKMEALIQNTDILYYRDKNRNKRSEESGKLFKGKRGVNFHTVSYGAEVTNLPVIGSWSAGCQVVNSTKNLKWLLGKVRNQKTISYCLLKEF